MIDKSKIGKNLDDLRKARRWSKSELSRQTGFSNALVGNHIKDGRMSLEAMITYCNALGCTADDILTGVYDKEDFTPICEMKDYYPWNLAVSVYRGDEEILDSVYKPKLLQAVASLSDREQQIIEMRFKHYMTLDECASRMKVTRERIRQVEAKVLRKLRNPARRFAFDIDKLYAERNEAIVERDKLKLENIVLRDKLNDLLKTDIGSIANEETEKQIKPKEIYIDEMELSVRSYNCIRRAGFTKVSDFQDVTVERLMHVRNLGRRSLEEIVAKLKEYGIEVKHEEE